ncbi:hypothetical protein N9N28_12460 [Rubripirellula amarantea]|uniref:Uncharacterized protein n=1 Tax=Rubripirellula amarantea TaxID=2527999 RepID=A0A5C5WL40_9BACT|nr:hypothetical protein [Rubripirellula amarantea]MDA8745438.1 hypothetical protein [Rubripirellula amarantea]TWT50482.1 hypothetical protein Pla22_32250 [Rubripirellula amarantea]
MSEESRERIDKLIQPFLQWSTKDDMLCCDLDVVDTFSVQNQPGERVHKVLIWDGFLAVSNEAKLIHFARLLSDSEEELKRDGLFTYGTDGSLPQGKNPITARSGACFVSDGKAIVELVNGQRYVTAPHQLVVTLGMGSFALAPVSSYNGFKSLSRTRDRLMDQLKNPDEIIEMKNGETWTRSELDLSIYQETRWTGDPKLPTYKRYFKKFKASNGTGLDLEYTVTETITQWDTTFGESPRIRSVELFERDFQMQNANKNVSRMIIDFDWLDEKAAQQLGVFDEKSLGLLYPPLKPILDAKKGEKEIKK